MNLTESQQPMFQDLQKEYPYCYKAPNKCSSQDLLPLKNIQQPRDSDVLYGRGGTTNKHPGNKCFRRIVENLKDEYLSAETHHDKYMICMKVVNEIRYSNPPGRFLMQDTSTKKWYDVGDKIARLKVGQALREYSKKQKFIRKNKSHTNPIQEKQVHRVLSSIENKYLKERTAHERTETIGEISSFIRYKAVRIASNENDKFSKKKQRVDHVSRVSFDERNSVIGANMKSQLKRNKKATYENRNIPLSVNSNVNDQSRKVSNLATVARNIIPNICYLEAITQYPICDQSNLCESYALVSPDVSVGDEFDLSIINNESLTSCDGVCVFGISDASVKTFPIGASISINYTPNVLSNNNDEADLSIATFSLTASLSSSSYLNRTLNNSSYDHNDIFSNSTINSPPQELLISPLSLQRDASDISMD